MELDILRISFKNKISQKQVPLFRAAVAKTAGYENILFHNHTENGYRHEYPLIQYKLIAGLPNIIAIGGGVAEISHFFASKERIIRLDGKTYPLIVYKTALNSIAINISPTAIWRYTLFNWLPLNQENYKKYCDVKSLADKVIFLQKVLTANILTFLEGFGKDSELEIKTTILDIKSRKVIRVNETLMESYSTTFESNVFLPNYIGLGKSSSQGHGIVRMIK